MILDDVENVGGVEDVGHVDNDDDDNEDDDNDDDDGDDDVGDV